MSHIIKSGTNIWKVGNNILSSKDTINFLLSNNTIVSGFAVSSINADVVQNKFIIGYVDTGSGNNTGYYEIYDLTTGILLYSKTGIGEVYQTCIEASTQYIWVCHPEHNYIRKYRISDGVLIATVSSFSAPRGLFIDVARNKYYVACSDGIQIRNISTDSQIGGTITIGLSRPQSLKFDINNNRWYVCNRTSSTVTIFNYSDDTVLATISGFSSPTSISLDIANNRYFVACLDGACVRIKRYSDNATIRDITNSLLIRPNMIELTNNLLYVSDATPSDLKIFKEIKL